GHLAWCHAALQAKQRHPQFDQMIKPVTDPIATPSAELRLAKWHPELPQITQLVDQQVGRRLAACQRPRHLTMGQVEFRWGNHNGCGFTSISQPLSRANRSRQQVSLISAGNYPYSPPHRRKNSLLPIGQEFDPKQLNQCLFLLSLTRF